MNLEQITSKESEKEKEEQKCAYQKETRQKSYCILTDEQCGGHNYIDCVIYNLDELFKEDH